MDTKEAPINIVIVALSEKFAQITASSLSKKLDMFMVDCNEMIVYDLIDPQDVLEKGGVEYFKKRERGVIKNCSEFLNTVISINYNLFMEYKDFFKNSLIFYLKLPKQSIEDVPSAIAYKERDKSLQEQTNNIINNINLEKRSSREAVEKIITKIGEIYEDC